VLKFVTFFLLILSFGASAELMMDISLVYEKGIDKDLVLTNELHTRLSTRETPDTHLIEMKNGIKVNLIISFLGDVNGYGPAGNTVLFGKIYGPSGDILDDLDNRKEVIALGQSKSFIYKTDASQQLEVKVTPFIR
jgi:hypothetical protein